MTDFDTKQSLGSLALNPELFVPGTVLEVATTLLDAATAGYVPAVGDVFCYKTDDTNKHQKYSAADGALIIKGIISQLEEDSTSPAVVVVSYAVVASVHYAKLGYTGTLNAAQKLALKNDLRAKNINLVD